jgi:hypothetical protein
VGTGESRGTQVPLGEGADGVGEQALLFGETEIHLRSPG